MRAAILITARLKSTRLKKKVLKPILGKPMFFYMIERLRLAKIPEKIVVCTSTVEQDDPLEDFVNESGVECFRGHPDDVLLRMRDAANKYDVDTIISCTADNPFVDPEYIDRLLEYHEDNDNDFTMVKGLPFGVFSYALNRKALNRACEIKDEVDTEVWGGYFTQTGLFKCGIYDHVDEDVRDPELRLTVDTQDDFDMVSRIFSKLYNENNIFPLKDIVNLCRSDESLRTMNAHIIQKSGKPIKLKNDAGKS